ncbi:MAG TPA: hypothetical protein VHZ78_14835 [Rhizomicrobium sp.]|nr:hypothetical protein [Rhizomicrobium sp.]
MRKWILAAVAVVLLGGVGIAFATGALKVGATSGVCETDDEVPAEDRASAGNAALAIVKAMMAGDSAAAYTSMTAETRANVPADKNAQFVQLVKAMMDKAPDPKVSHVYLVDTAGSGPDARAICGLVSGDRWVSLEVKPGLRQAHVVVTAQTHNNAWEFSVWLLPEAGGWRVQYVNLNPSTIVGHTVDDMLALARQARDAGHIFNAAMLYSAAQQLMSRGPAFQLGVAQTINDDLAHFTLPPELQGQPPFVWTMGGKSYTVGQAGAMGIAGQIGLAFALPQTRWADDAQIDARNREFLDAFRAAHPDYADSFSFLVARALKPDNSGGFGTVYDNKKGYAK